jgi:hypothetical protein
MNVHPQLDIYALARKEGRTVKRDWQGRPTITMRGPGHGPGDASLSVTLDPTWPDGYFVNSFCNDDAIACRDHVRSLAGLPAWAPSKGSWTMTARPAAPVPTEPDKDQKRKLAWVREHVREILHGAGDLRETIGEKYFTSRGLIASEDIANVVKFHPKCPWREDENAPVIYVPAVVCAMRDIHTDKIVAAHRRRLTPEGQKVGKPKMFGPSGGAAVKIDPDESVTMGLAVGEGVETCLSARQLGFRPVWALGSAGAIAKFPVMSGIEALTLLAEDDKSGANARAIEECRARWHAAGCEVLQADSLIGGDLNDALHALEHIGRAS